MSLIIIHGLASQTKVNLEIKNEELDINLLTWLRTQNITIASSCEGQGVCQKCCIQNNWKTCQLSVEDFLNLEPSGILKVSYL